MGYAGKKTGVRLDTIEQMISGLNAIENKHDPDFILMSGDIVPFLSVTPLTTLS